MSKSANYTLKYKTFEDNTLFKKLDEKQQDFIKEISFRLRFTFQEFRQVVEASRDLRMWGEDDLDSWWLKIQTLPISHQFLIKKTP